MIGPVRASPPTTPVRCGSLRRAPDDFREERMNPIAFRAAAAGVALAAVIWAAAPPSPAQEKKAGAVSFEIKPAPLTEDREERALPGPVGDACVGGGGRFIVLIIPSERKIALFDVNEAKVVKTLLVEDDNPSAAASLDKLIVAGGGKLDRYSLETFEKEGSIKLPTGQTGAHLLMGSATRGPLLGLVEGAPGVLSPNTLKPIPSLTIDVGKREKWAEGATRISADGRVITTYNPHSSPQGHIAYVRSGTTYKKLSPDNSDVSGHFAPGPEGRFFYTAVGVLNAAGKPVGKKGAYGDGSKYSLPAAEGEGFFLRIDVPGFPHGNRKKTGKVYLHATGDDRPLGELTGVEAPVGLNHWGREKFGVDKRFFLVPSAQLLVTLPDSLDKLILHRINLDKLLESAEYDYLVVASRAPREAVVGTVYTYEPSVKSKKGGVKLKLETAPKGMKIEDGKLTWTVPGALAGREVDVSIAVSDSAGREIFHTFKLDIRAK
jgi:hypothetical protein